ncbi:sugar transferase [Paenibacillus kobensis]|uniref:sugar transferase n=1 Tax=Paenibacillus kobensis TaxID=59841 RepID=UPI000FD80155|nr:exopolysaccharide biosynthesis polyprenyl glycosylphosphotransferase [Paenibacillus kobensis]
MPLDYELEAGQQDRCERKAVYETMKRVMDVGGAIIGLLLLLPILTVAVLLIKLESPRGQVIFCQTRVGKNGKEFRMFKFRSMVPDAENRLEELLKHNEIQGSMFKMKSDPRITGIGRFIRKTSIDELPQLVNVLRGEMSLVGPRPPLPREVEQYSNHHKRRLDVIPGCTGLWQVSGRNDLSFEQMVELDLVYIRKRSIWFDFKILLKTVKVFILPNSAY